MAELTISKSSRLGRYYDWLYRGCSGNNDITHWASLKNLCQLVRRLAFMTFLTLLIYSLVFVVVGWTLFCAGLAVYWPIAHGFTAPNVDFLGPAFWFGVFVWLIVMSAGIVFVVGGVMDRRYMREYERLKANGFIAPPPKPNLAREWLKAKKEKVCPLIKVVD